MNGNKNSGKYPLEKDIQTMKIQVLGLIKDYVTIYELFAEELTPLLNGKGGMQNTDLLALSNLGDFLATASSNINMLRTRLKVDSPNAYKKYRLCK